MYKGKRKKTKFIIAAIAGVAVAGALFLIDPIRVLIAIKTMKPLETQEVITDIYAIKNEFVNLYLVRNGDQIIAFDAGTDNEATKAALDSFGIDADEITAVFLTHTDYDHVAALSLFRSADIYMADSNKTFLASEAGQFRSEDFVGLARAYETMTDGETVTVADTEVRCIYTPGHTDGSACYIVNGRFLFTGDTMNLKNGAAVPYNAVFNMNGGEQRRSLRRLAALENIEVVFTMHTGYTTDFEAAFSRWAE
ncbi:MAG: MBL fold metallo-hydrolase [Oscillospiraceae bacterium]|jgi:glyoxylase-like metal-dependent hydrolase (beta-lactamase superfamily II)|nr:MBL fold metallo-hydrolase [Oscillospiraceae bacterium]